MISPFHYDILKKELFYLEEIGELAPNEAERLLRCYKVGYEKETKPARSIHFFEIISIIGSILIGLSVLSFVASNWSALSSMEKFFLLLGGLIVSYVLAWFLEESKPVLSKSLYYIGVFVYGAEIFYIGQMFHLGGELANALFAWSLGFLSLAFYKSDQILYFFGYGLIYLSIQLKFLFVEGGDPSLWMLIVLPLLFLISAYGKTMSPYLQIANYFVMYQFIEMKFLLNNEYSFLWMLPVLAGLFLLSEVLFKKDTYLRVVNLIILYQFVQTKIGFEAIENGSFLFLFALIVPVLFIGSHKLLNKSPILFGFNVILAIQVVLLAFYHMEVSYACWYLGFIFMVGLIFTHFQLSDYQNVMKNLGIVLQFGAGILLTMEFAYPADAAVPYELIFGLLYLIYGVYLVYKNKLFGVLLVSALIFRFYVDVSLAFMNKSIAFFIGGTLLLGLGYWFERTRRGEKMNEEKAAAR
nr:DUF2157 domain-containing protein [Metabacillus lacus]